MKETMLAVAAAATLVIAAAIPTQADAHWRGRGGGALIGGLALGAIAGAAIASSRPAYAYPPAYHGYGPAYYGPTCYVTKERFWDGYGWRIRRVQVC